jgi:glucokinase
METISITSLNNNSFVLVADIGGSHITSAICDLRSSTLVPGSVKRAEFSSKGAAEQVLNVWIDCLRQSMKSVEFGISGVGFAIPGPFDYENGISYITGLNKFEALYGMDIRKKLSDALQIDPDLLRFRNDAEAAIEGEWLFGAGRNYKKVMGITLGTGFGSAFAENGVARDLDLANRKYKDSIADDHLSTRWFLKRYAMQSGLSVVGVKELTELAGSREMAKMMFKEFGANMARFLQEPLAEYKPEALLICGNIAKSSRLFLNELKKTIDIPIHTSELWESAALFGASRLFIVQDMQAVAG